MNGESLPSKFYMLPRLKRGIYIHLIGTKSSGKTFSMNAVARELGAIVEAHFEVARTLLKELNITGTDLDSNLESSLDFHQKIVERHARIFEGLAAIDPRTKLVRIFNRTVLDALVYTWMKGADVDAMINSTDFQQCGDRYKNQNSRIVHFPFLPHLVTADGARMNLSHEVLEHLSEMNETFMQNLGIQFYTPSLDLSKLNAKLVHFIVTELLALSSHNS
ncbi:hypothetical protein BJ742DRAFT_273975 [Cladochytrium replicatum]|nr:hypothetical protein BJ742DRAFT_273975 [Cladochytrium replicatum]